MFCEVSMSNLSIMSVILLLALFSTLNARPAPLQTVNQVDLQRYLGMWHQLAYFPNTFQPRDAQVASAEYTLSDKGYIIVHNISYYDQKMTRIKKQIKGKAFVTDKSNSKLRVQFFWPFRGNYWIIDLDQKDYSYAVVSEPNRKYLWILVRPDSITKEVYDGILERLRANSFDLSKLVLTGSLKGNP